jgi:hypothetical protein
VAVAVAAAPILPALRPDITGIAAVEVAALAWVRLSTLTRYTRLTASSGGGTPVADGVTVSADPLGNNTSPPGVTARGTGDGPGPPATGAVVLRGLGILAGRSARRLPEAEEKLRGGARRAGRHAARIQRAWRKPPS